MKTLKHNNALWKNRIDCLKIEIQRREKTIDDIIFINSHKLRSPVVAILGLVQLLEPDCSTDTNKQVIKLLKDEVLKLDKITRKVSEISYNNDQILDVENRRNDDTSF